MDKLIHGGRGVTITNDGATVMRELQIQHPAAKLLADISKAQDDEVGDGTTSVVVLAGELLREAKRFLEDGLPPQTILKGYRKACQLALGKLHDLAIDLGSKSPKEKEDMFIKTFSYAGFEQQPKTFTNPKVLLLHLELELKAEKDNAEVRLSSPDEYQSIVDAEWRIIYEKLEKIVESGAQVILSRLAIGDLATQYFADRGIFCAGRVEGEDMQRTAIG